MDVPCLLGRGGGKFECTALLRLTLLEGRGGGSKCWWSGSSSLEVLLVPCLNEVEEIHTDKVGFGKSQFKPDTTLI